MVNQAALAQCIGIMGNLCADTVIRMQMADCKECWQACIKLVVRRLDGSLQHCFQPDCLGKLHLCDRVCLPPLVLDPWLISFTSDSMIGSVKAVSCSPKWWLSKWVEESKWSLIVGSTFQGKDAIWTQSSGTEEFRGWERILSTCYTSEASKQSTHENKSVSKRCCCHCCSQNLFCPGVCSSTWGSIGQ